MSDNDKNNADKFSHYLLSSKLEELEKLTSNLYAELQDSKKVMAEICTLMDSIPKEQADRPQQSNGLRHEDISQFLVAPTPNLLMPDMSQNTVDVDLDSMIAEMKQYAESIRNNIVHTQESQQEHATRPIETVDWEQCAISMDKFGKRITNIKMVKSTGGNRNMELEAKMDELCKDVNMFTQVSAI